MAMHRRRWNFKIEGDKRITFYGPPCRDLKAEALALAAEGLASEEIGKRLALPQPLLNAILGPPESP